MTTRSNLPSGADRVVELLRDEGVDRVFGNPGSTELAMVDAIVGSGDIAYCLFLHESCAVPAADGYAQATGRTAFCSLHTVSGLGNAVGALANVKANGTPMVVVAGQQDRRLLEHGPLLGYDLAAIARPVVKWAAEVRSEADLGPMLRRAFLSARTEPMGPVFLALPHDLMLDEAPSALPPRSDPPRPGLAEATPRIAAALAEAKAPAIIVGQEMASAAGQAAIIGLAERLGAPLFGAFNMQRGVVPPSHPLWRGDVPPFAAAIHDLLAAHDVVFHAGGQAFQLFGGPPAPILPETTRFIHLAPSPEWLGGGHPASISSWGDLAGTVAAIAQAVPQRAGPGREDGQARAVPASAPSGRFDPVEAARQILGRLPEGSIVHNELPSAGFALRSLFAWTESDQFFSSKQTIGWAMGAAIGVSLGHERKRRSAVIVGDGSAALALPALWSAARSAVPVIYAIIDNSGYGILEGQAQSYPLHAVDRSTAFSLANPPIDFAAIGQAMGLATATATDPAMLDKAMSEALATGLPFLIHVKVAPAL